MIYRLLDRLRPWIAWSGALVGIAIVALFSANPLPRNAEVRPVELTVRADETLGPISPFIYGIAQPSPQHFRQLRLKLWRWGGNPASRYNWEKGNCWNAAADW